LGVSPPGHAAQGRSWRTGGKHLPGTTQTTRSRFHFIHSRPLRLTGPLFARSQPQLGAGAVRHPLGSLCCWKAVTSGGAGDCEAALCYSNRRDDRLTAHLPADQASASQAAMIVVARDSADAIFLFKSYGRARSLPLLTAAVHRRHSVRGGGSLTRSRLPPPLTSISSISIASPL